MKSSQVKRWIAPYALMAGLAALAGCGGNTPPPPATTPTPTSSPTPTPSPTPLPLSAIWGSDPLENRLPGYMKSYGTRGGVYTGNDSDLEAELENLGVLSERLRKPFVDAKGHSHNPYEAGFAYVTSFYSDSHLSVAITGITNLPAPIPAATPMATPSSTPTPTPILTATPSPSLTPSPTPSPSPEASPAESATPLPSPSPSLTPSPTPSSTPMPSPSPAPSPSPIPSSTPAPEHLTVYAVAFRANAQEGLDCPVSGTFYLAKIPSTPGFEIVSLGGMVHSDSVGDKPFGGQSYEASGTLAKYNGLKSDTQLILAVAMNGSHRYDPKKLGEAQCRLGGEDRLGEEDLRSAYVREGDLYFPQEEVGPGLPKDFLTGGGLEDVFTPSTQGLDAKGDPL